MTVRSQPKAGRGWRGIPSAPTRIVGVYALLGVAWIALSDRVLRALVPDAAARDAAQTLKGMTFVVLTSVVLHLLIRRSERRLRALSTELRATLDGMADAVLVVDERGRVVETNRATLQLLGAASKEEVLGPIEAWARRWGLRAPDGSPVASERLASVRALRGEANARYEGILRRADGTDVFVSVSAAPIEPPGGPPLVVTVLRDVSPARRLDDAREEFLSAAAHELKTPLAVIKAYAQLMAKHEPAERRALSVIQRQVDRLTRIVQQLLDVSRLRLDPSVDDARPERFDLAALADEVVAGLRAEAPRHRLKLSARGPAPVRADRERIARVLSALVENGVRFSPAGGEVELRVDAAAGEARVSVHDRGMGIPPERQARVFERYYRAHSGLAGDPGGLGVGLEVSRGIVQRHGGRMWFESAPGEGSIFHFTLPLAEPRA